MISERYLELGFTGLGRCKRNIWNAHFPAAVLAGFYFTARNQLPRNTEREIESQLNRLIALKRELFDPYPKSGTSLDAEAPITEALEASIDKFSELGHNSIFAAYALRAMRDLGCSGREQTVHDIASVIRQMNGGPARYWLRIGKGHDPRKFALSERTLFHDSLPSAAIAEAILTELRKFKVIYTQMGSKSHVGHLLTQSHSLIVLRDLGYGQLANRGLYSLECRFVLLKDSQPHVSSPKSFYRPATRSATLPDDPSYWRQDFSKCEWDEGHSFKYTYSCYELMGLVADEEVRTKAFEKFRYLITPNERSTPT